MPCKMDLSKTLEDQLREAACFGDEEAVRAIIEKGVNVNSQHNINGWTALHWAAKRGHFRIAVYLLNHGADKNLPTIKGELAVQLTENEDIQKLLGGEIDYRTLKFDLSDALPFAPNYMSYSPFVHLTDSSHRLLNGNHIPNIRKTTMPHEDLELVLKVRLANDVEKDFIEVELERSNLTYEAMLNVCCQELQVDRKGVQKVRKLPDTILRKDKDVRRLKDFQELELVLNNKVSCANNKPNHFLTNNSGLMAVVPPPCTNTTILY